MVSLDIRDRKESPEEWGTHILVNLVSRAIREVLEIPEFVVLLVMRAEEETMAYRDIQELRYQIRKLITLKILHFFQN
jgi:hypothetical protein